MKKLISLVTAGMLAMSLAACGSSGSGSAAAAAVLLRQSRPPLRSTACLSITSRKTVK